MSKIEPALTAEEWQRQTVAIGGPIGTKNVTGDGVDWLGYDRNEEIDWSDRRHAVAALALYGQPFGFTREDVENIREVCFIVSAEFDNGSERDSRSKALLSLADRIEALLPPEVPHGK